MSDAAGAAAWMKARLDRDGSLYQDDAVGEIQRQFGDDYVYDNENGNLAIAKDVLKEFRALTETYVVWDRGERAWRRREPYDGKGRQAE